MGEKEKRGREASGTRFPETAQGEDRAALRGAGASGGAGSSPRGGARAGLGGRWGPPGLRRAGARRRAALGPGGGAAGRHGWEHSTTYVPRIPAEPARPRCPRRRGRPPA